MPLETSLWLALRSAGKQYRTNRKRLRRLVKAAAHQHWSVQEIADASTLQPTIIRKYIK